jgi:hypothetical protein
MERPHELAHLLEAFVAGLGVAAARAPAKLRSPP